MSKNFTIALAGNPNCGKTCLFNALTGSKQHVGNWPGVTVEKKEGKLRFGNKDITVVDLPGTYSLGAYSEDEVVARDFILKEKPDVVINVVDSSNIERNLYLTMQILETGAKVVMALNMIDEAKSRNINIDSDKLSELLNIAVVPTVATKNYGIEDLVNESIKTASAESTSYKIDYGNDIHKEVEYIDNAFNEYDVSLDYSGKWIALKLLEDDEYVKKYMTERGFSGIISNEVKQSIGRLTKKIGYEPDTFIIDKRYDAISEVVKRCVKKQEVKSVTVSDKIDKWITNKWLGIPIFAIIMFFMYQITMKFGNDFLGGKVGDLFSALGSWAGGALESIGAPKLFTSFITDAVIGGLGSVLTFIPMIFTMYLLISILEDSGYMARAAYVMDKFMNAVGLHGKTAVSLIIGTGCNVAGVMSTRTLESKKDRMIAILISPFMSCTARLTVFALFASAFFSGKKLWIFDQGGVVVFSLYVIGIVVAILFGKFLSKKAFKSEESYFVMELPPYRIPTAKSIFIHMWEKSSAFVKKAGTIIFSVVVVIWVLSNLPAGVEPGTEKSIIGMIGTFIAPIFKPAGFGTWQASVALIAGFAAKEAVVGTMGTVYGASEDKLAGVLQHSFTPLTAFAFMVMTLLYVPCVATIGAVRRETNSRKWALAVVAYTCIIGWVAAVIVYQGGRLLGLQ